MNVLLFGEIKPATAHIHKTLSKISDETNKLEEQCIDCCSSCRNFKAHTITGGIFSAQMAACEKGHWVHHMSQICCDGRYHMFYNYVPTQEFLKMKLKLRKFIKGVKSYNLGGN